MSTLVLDKGKKADLAGPGIEFLLQHFSFSISPAQTDSARLPLGRHARDGCFGLREGGTPEVAAAVAAESPAAPWAAWACARCSRTVAAVSRIPIRPKIINASRAIMSIGIATPRCCADCLSRGWAKL